MPKIASVNDREVARKAIRGPLTRQKFEAELVRICGSDLPEFDTNLTNASTW